MRPPQRVFLAVFAAVHLIAAACGSGGDDNGGSAQATSTPVQASTATSTSDPTATTEPDTDAVPAFQPGAWTEGEAEVRVTGETPLSMNGTLLARSSSTDGGTTRLTFTDDLDTINISISSVYQPFGISVTIDNVRSESVDVPCAVTYTAREENRVAGTFTCENVRIRSYNSAIRVGDTAGLEGSFRATR